jgi:hypothetical protein
MRSFGGCLRRLPRRGDAGFVVVTVVIAFTVLTLFVLAALAYTLTNASQGRVDQDSKIAVAAAQAGLEDYLSHLNADADYWQKGNVDPDNPALGSTDGKVIQGTAGAGARFGYQVLSTLDGTARSGVVRVLVTGSSSPGAGHRRVSRSLTVTLKPKTFLDFAYLSDIEVMDPVLVGGDPGCANYAYGSDSRLGRTCAPIIWKTGDRIEGPLHSNDALTIDSAVDFRSPQTESSWPDIQGAGPSATTWLGAATTLAGYRPAYAPPLPLPEGNTEMTSYVAPNPQGGPPGPGCYYTGATRIVFQGTTMRVFSPSTSDPNTPDRCLDVTSRATEQVKPIPPVIYVDGTSASCTTGEIGYPAVGEAVTAGSATDASWGKTTNYDCSRGSAYVSGQADAQVSLAAADDVVVTDDLTLADGGSGDNVIGLIAGGYVWVRHPLDASGNNLAGEPVVHTIQAAVLSLRHSFVVQNWDVGAFLGTLNVLGSIAQRMRGPVGATDPTTGVNTGYLKGYIYDTRYKSLQPPYFLKPGANLWRILDVTDG